MKKRYLAVGTLSLLLAGMGAGCSNRVEKSADRAEAAASRAETAASRAEAAATRVEAAAERAERAASMAASRGHERLYK